MTAAVIFGISGTTLSPDEIELFSEVDPYGFILFTRNLESAKQIKRLIGELEETVGRSRLPILIDQEGGRVARLKPPLCPVYPPAQKFADMFKHAKQRAERACYLNARLIAHDLYDLGITVNCAPVADLPVAGAHDVIGDRAFGHAPEQVIALARAQVKGFMDGGIVPVLKHIPGHGRAKADSHHELPVVDASLDLLRKTDFVPFKALNDLPMAMTAHVLYPAIDKEKMATISPAAIRIIREEIGFKGLLMSDDIYMKAMKGNFTQRAKDVLSAGCDIVLHGNGLHYNFAEMQEAVEGVTELSGASLIRAKAAMDAVNAPQVFDVAAMRKELAQLMGM